MKPVTNGRIHLLIAMALIFAALFLATDEASWQGWNLLGNLIGFIVSAAILTCVYLGRKLWVWLVRVFLWIPVFLIILQWVYLSKVIISGSDAEIGMTRDELIQEFSIAGAIRGTAVIFLLGYVLWVLCFSKSVRQHWLVVRKM